jgi:hypothetical protein
MRKVQSRNPVAERIHPTALPELPQSQQWPMFLRPILAGISGVVATIAFLLLGYLLAARFLQVQAQAGSADCTRRTTSACHFGLQVWAASSCSCQAQPSVHLSCHNRIMPTRSSKPKDHGFATVARRVVEQAIGEKLDGSPLDDPNAGKNPAAVALGKLGGAKGGAARAAALSPAKRRAIAKKAAAARWKSSR